MIPRNAEPGIYIPAEEHDTCTVIGLCKEYYPNGSLKYEGALVKCSKSASSLCRDGVWKLYYYGSVDTIQIIKTYNKGVMVDVKEYYNSVKVE